jgi:hypothetical protein
MKIQWIAMLALVAGLVSCTKDSPVTADYRDAVVGDYVGISVFTYWGGNGFNHDTSDIMISLTKSDMDSLVKLSFIPKYHAEYFLFVFEGGAFTSKLVYRPPVLKLSYDSLYFKHLPGLGPYWKECFAIKFSD